MKYMGSKNKHAKYILPFIYKSIEKLNASSYVEPFVGGGNLIDKVEVSIPKIANDSHYYLIELLKAIQNGWVPPEYVDEETYKDVRINKDKYEPCLVGFVGFGCSYSGKWFGGFARNVSKDDPNSDILNKTSRNYCAESKRNLLKQAGKLKNIHFKQCSFIDLDIPEKSVIYCDPPYKNTTAYKDKFDHDIFWEWAEIMNDLGNIVLVSEYSAPDNWECIWQKEVNNSLTKDTGGKTGVEKLFKLKSI